ncbi:MAG: DUF1080 domain-containing protein [Fibrobacteria bacterium]
MRAVHTGFRIASGWPNSMGILVALVLALPPFVRSQDQKSLFDGSTLKGWRVLGNGAWSVADGAIVGKHSPKDAPFTHLVYDSTVKDFRLGFQFKHVKGNSGCFLRLEERNPPPEEGVLGVQTVIEPTLLTDNAFGFYETTGRLWIKKWSYSANKSLYKAGQWNTMRITAKGPDVTLEVNGSEIVKLSDPQGRMQGKIAFKMHGGRDVEVHFKDVQLEDLKPVALRLPDPGSPAALRPQTGKTSSVTADGRWRLPQGKGSGVARGGAAILLKGRGASPTP